MKNQRDDNSKNHKKQKEYTDTQQSSSAYFVHSFVYYGKEAVEDGKTLRLV